MVMTPSLSWRRVSVAVRKLVAYIVDGDMYESKEMFAGSLFLLV
jgi:hypothetical protein